MGRYMRKTKPTAEVAVMDVNVTIGVRTRAKTLAARRQAMAAPPPPPPAAATAASGGYLQLRSRRLEKPSIVLRHSNSKRQRLRSPNTKAILNPNSKSSSRARAAARPADSGSPASAQKEEVAASGENRAEEEIEKGDNNDNGGNANSIDNQDESKDLGIEASFGENFLDAEGRERSTRESTPCSLIRDPEAIRTPGSTTRPTSSTETSRRIQNSLRGNVPTAQEMDDFFTGAEKEQQRQFVEKYNFDPVNDKPLPGRYKWEKLDP